MRFWDYDKREYIEAEELAIALEQAKTPGKFVCRGEAFRVPYHLTDDDGVEKVGLQLDRDLMIANEIHRKEGGQWKYSWS